MKIAHVVSYISADGAFGGPVAVAASQARELARRGHDVDLLGGWDGQVRFDIEGVNVRLFKAIRLAPGLSGLASPALARQLRAGTTSYDVVHIHFGRDLISLPAAVVSLAGTRLILQPHGMVMPDRRAKARILDAIAVRKILGGSAAILALTKKEEEGLAAVGAPARIVHTISNGVERSQLSGGKRAFPPVVLFMARLHPRKRVLAFAEAAALMLDSGVDADFRIVGPDEGDLPALRRLIDSRPELRGRIEYRGPVPPGRGLAELAAATVFVLPSHGEVFPMTVLEALSVGTPVVMTDDCGIAAQLDVLGAASVVEGTASQLARAVTELLDSDELRKTRADAGFASLREWLGIERVVDELEEHYRC